MKKIRQKSEYEAKGTELSTYPSMFANKNYGEKRKAKTHNVVMKNSKTGQVFGYKTIEEGMKFSDYLILEAEDTRLPTSVVGEITGLIRKGAKDLQQAWKNAFELVHTAYHVANVKRPTPDQKGAWKQYEELLRVAVKALADTRGLSGQWRMSSTAFTEGQQTPELDQILEEKHQGRNHRIFVRVRNIGFDDAEEEYEVEAGSLDDVIQSFMSQAKRNGRSVKIQPVATNQVDLTVYVKGITGATREEQVIKVKDLSI